ncbi:Protein CBG01364 [Caenorhabditis briggsae]|uniref:Protein CBG01364 n=1 Tax=Caenorhabditis briggsae TaxID=6238 RepID=A8WQ88_CAEBR|nr:Protein CBG01364 [Caenorhabditis briggsae]CAP22646.1 Protein CBG01364 [Caenorhabditis briggsae]
MNQRRFELLCAALLGFGQLCIMTGFDSESFILESVIHSIHEREPARISQYAGYYGQAVIYAFYMIACMFSPSILAISTPKINLVLSAIFFTAFPIGFLFTNSYYYFFSCALLGVGFALFYQGQGGYLTSHSTRETIESNVSFSWSVACCCMILGSGILAIITKVSSTEIEHLPEALNITKEAHKMERRFSDMEISFLFTAFTGCSVLGIITFFLMPSKDVENCIESTSEKKETFTGAFKLTCSTLVSWKMVQLMPLFCLVGLNTSFWLSVFPTAMSFTTHNSHLIYLPAVYSCAVGSGEVVMGILISFLSKRIKNFGQKPTMTIGAIFTSIYCVLIHLSTAMDAPMRPSHAEPILFHHSYLLAFTIGFICGIGDCCINSVRSVICALAWPKRRPQAFSVSKVFQALASCILFFLSPITPLYVYTIGLPVLSIIAAILFFSIAKRTQTMERKMTEGTRNAFEIGKKLNL